MTEQEKLAASIIDKVSDVVERQHPEVERSGDDALIHDREYYNLENSIVQMLPPALTELHDEKIKLETTLEAKAGQIIEFEHMIVSLEGEVKARNKEARALALESTEFQCKVSKLEKKYTDLLDEKAAVVHELFKRRKEVEELSKVTANQASWILEFTGRVSPD